MPRRRKETNASSVSTTGRSFSFKTGHSEEFKEKPQQRNAANARERARMRVLSRAFCRLKTTLPWVPADTKLSKLDTLRLATTYIGHLRAVLVEGSPTSSPPLPSHPLSMSWPFMFNKSSDPTDSSLSGSESPSSTSDQYTCKDFDPEEQMKIHLSQATHSNYELTVHHQAYEQPYSSMHELGYSDHLMELH